MRIGLLAKRAGVSASSLRFYEARGLLPRSARRANGYRDYDERSLEVIRFINRARGLGFSLAEIARHLSSPKDGARKSRVLASLERKRHEIDALVLDLQSRRAALVAAIKELRTAGVTRPRASSRRRP